MNSTIKMLTAVMSTMLVVGCASTKSEPTQYLDISIPSLNTEASATLGENLLMQAIGTYAETVTVEALDAYTADIPKTTVFYRTRNTNYFHSDEEGSVILNNGFGQPLSRQSFITYTPGDNKFCVGMMNCFSDKEATFTYSPEKLLKVQPNSFQQVIEYNGKSGDTLKFTYREFSNNLARGSFTTDFTMDLKEGNQFGYKGALIEVIDATNSQIKYKVLKNFNKKL